MKHLLPAQRWLLALLFVQSSVAFAAVDWIWLSKDMHFWQTSAAGPVLEAPRTPCNYGCPYRISAIVGGASVASIPPPVLSGPINTALLGSAWNGGRLQLVPGPPVDVWQLGNGNLEFSGTRAGLDAKFANGTYTVAAGGASVALNISGDAYPAPSALSFSTGSWGSDGYFVVDPRQPLTITTSRFTEYGSGVDAAIHLFVGPGPAGNIADFWQYRSSSAGSPTGFVTIPANTLVDGQEYYIGSAFEVVVDQNTTAFAPARATGSYRAITNVRLKAQSQPIFPMTVNANITPTVANATATFQPRPEDVGKTASVYVFAVAPSTRVKNGATNKAARLPTWARGAADSDVQCVLAQLNAAGELQAVSVASLQAYVTATLDAQGRAVTILDKIVTANIAGVTFYLGYGRDPQAMLTDGVNQRAVMIDASIACDPKPPQTGWWWNADESGRGYSIEVQGNHLFFASYLYDISGRATWLVSMGRTSLDGSLYTGGELFSLRGGQTLGGPYGGYPPTRAEGAVTLAFNDASHGTLIWPGGTIALRRFEIAPGGLTRTAAPNQPESGWWWNEAEAGRGFFLEWQGGQLFMAGYMYDENGNPIWYFSGDSAPSANPQNYSGTWQQLANGPTMSGPYRAPVVASTNVAPVTIRFEGSRNAVMTLPNGRTTSLTRFGF